MALTLGSAVLAVLLSGCGADGFSLRTVNARCGSSDCAFEGVERAAALVASDETSIGEWHG